MHYELRAGVRGPLYASYPNSGWAFCPKGHQNAFDYIADSPPPPIITHINPVNKPINKIYMFLVTIFKSIKSPYFNVYIGVT